MRELVFVLCAVAVVLTGCGGGGDGADVPEDGAGATSGTVDTVGDLSITSRQVVSDRTLFVTGTLTIAAGGELVLERATLQFAPRVEDSGTFRMEGDARLTGVQSRIESGSGRQWNLEATGACAIMLDRCVVTGHSGLRLFGGSSLSVSGEGDVEELQVRDSARVSIRDGAGAYVVLFLGSGVRASLPAGALAAGEDMTREFDVPTSATTTGHVSLQAANVYGWQLDLEGDAHVAVEGGQALILALHLKDTVRTIDQSISPTTASGAVDFSSNGGPRFTWTSSRIDGVNLYAEGASDLAVTGAVHVNEPSIAGRSRITFGPQTLHAANLAVAAESSELRFDRVTLEEEEEVAPSFTAEDQGIIRIDGVAATPRTRVAAVGAGQVYITGGSGWTADKLEAVDVTGSGGVFVDGARVRP